MSANQKEGLGKVALAIIAWDWDWGSACSTSLLEILQQ